MIRLFFILFAAMATPTFAQNQHSVGQPTEVGQSAFAAMTEIVGLLREDPDTDWQRVDIPALRKHLVDMDVLIMDTFVETKISGSIVAFSISGDDRTVQAIHRMVPAHAPFMDAATGWTTSVEVETTGATMMIEGDVDAIEALGFYGVMTIGAHHQEHHLAMAAGFMAH